MEVYNFIFYQHTAEGEFVWLSYYQDSPEFGWQAPNANSVVSSDITQAVHVAADRMQSEVRSGSVKELLTKTMHSPGNTPEAVVHICEAEISNLKLDAFLHEGIVYAPFPPELAVNAIEFSVLREAIAKRYGFKQDAA
ncbi:MAG: hypothetical protein WDN27_00275 [Candidatus Saccharibacteria bacterium]